MQKKQIHIKKQLTNQNNYTDLGGGRGCRISTGGLFTTRRGV